jgi:peroxiredoxin
MDFAALMAKLPMPAMMAFPFETMWTRARAGALSVGSIAPDFELATVDKKSKVKLSSFRGARPVVLVFGSYT